MIDLTGRTLHGYIFQAEVGAIFGARIYKAYRIKAQVPVMIRAYGAYDRLQPDLSTVKTLESDHLIPILDDWKDENGQFLVEAWVEQTTLEQYLKTKKELSTQGIIALAQHMAVALETLHQQHFFCGYIQPEDLFHDTSRGWRLRLPQRIDSSRLVLTTLPFDPFYCSSEFLLGNKPDARSDLFSLGMILWECLAGKPTQNPWALITERMADDWALPTLKLEEASRQALEVIIRKATTRQPEDRYTEASLLLREISDLV